MRFENSYRQFVLLYFLHCIIYMSTFSNVANFFAGKLVILLNTCQASHRKATTINHPCSRYGLDSLVSKLSRMSSYMLTSLFGKNKTEKLKNIWSFWVLGSYSNQAKSFTIFSDIHWVDPVIWQGPAVEEQQAQDTFWPKYFATIQNQNAAFELPRISQ